MFTDLVLVKTRKQARQIVSHGHILINGKKVNIASYRIKAGDVVAVADASKNIAIIKEAVEEGKATPSWLEFDASKFAGKVLQNPNRDVVDFELNEALIVEFYSR